MSLLFPPYLLLLRTKAFPQLQTKRGGPVVVVEGVQPLAGRRDQQKEKAEEHGEQTLAGSGSDTSWGHRN